MVSACCPAAHFQAAPRSGAVPPCNWAAPPRTALPEQTAEELEGRLLRHVKQQQARHKGHPLAIRRLQVMHSVGSRGTLGWQDQQAGCPQHRATGQPGMRHLPPCHAERTP